MKKILLSAVLIIPVLWAGLTWFASNKTEAVFDENITEANKKMAEEFPFITMKKKSFEKGFTSSTAKSEITLNEEFMGLFDAPGDEPITLTMNHKIYHGPVMMTPNGTKTGSSYIMTTMDQESLPEEVKKIIKLVFDGKEPMTSGMLMDAGGDIEIDMDLAPMSFNNEKFLALTGEEDPGSDDVDISFEGMTGHFTTNEEGTRLKGAFNLGAMEVKGVDNGEPIHMVNAASVANFDINELYKGTILDGTFEMTFPEIIFIAEDNEITMKGFKVVSTAEEKNGLFGGFGILDIDKLLIKSPDMPMEFPESKIHLKFGVEGFDRASIIKLVDLEQEMRAAQMKFMGNSLSDEELDDAAMDAMMGSVGTYYAAIVEMVKPGIEIMTDLELSNDTGKSAINFGLNYADTKKLLDLKTIREVIMALKGQLKISIDKSMLAGTELEEAIAMPMAMGFAVEKDGAYESVADLASGELKVNGEPMPVLDMLGGMIDQPIPWDDILSTAGALGSM